MEHLERAGAPVPRTVDPMLATLLSAQVQDVQERLCQLTLE
jgi:hypothetical protein